MPGSGKTPDLALNLFLDRRSKSGEVLSEGLEGAGTTNDVRAAILEGVDEVGRVETEEIAVVQPDRVNRGPAVRQEIVPRR
jgi:hypothetical protein